MIGRFSNRVGERLGTLRKGSHLEDAHRAVPDDRARRAELLREELRRFRADVENHLIGFDFVNAADAVGCIRRKGFGGNNVNRHRKGCALLFQNGEHLLAFIHKVGLRKGLPDRMTRSQKERIENAAAHDQAIHLFREVRENRELRGNLGARDNGSERALRGFEGLRERINFLRHQGTRAGNRRKAGNAHRGRFRTVRRAEGVVHINVAERRILLRERFVALLFAHVAAAVFQNHQIARLHIDAVNPILNERHLASEELADAVGHYLQRIGRQKLTFLGAAEMARHHHGSAGSERHADRREARLNAGVVRNRALIVAGHVEVAADQDALSGKETLIGQIFKSIHMHSDAPERKIQCRKSRIIRIQYE